MNRRWLPIASVLAVPLLGLFITLGAAPAPNAVEKNPSRNGDISVYFSPDGGCTDAVVRELGAAKSEIDLQAYSFTSAPIAEAVARAYARGVKVTVILDKSQRSAHYSGATYLANHHVPTFIDDKHAIAHNKIIIIDRQTVVTGSFNFTKAAEKENAENLLVLHRPELAQKYLENFQDHLTHSQPYAQ